MRRQGGLDSTLCLLARLRLLSRCYGSLCMTEGTGCQILLSLWSYVIITPTSRAQIAYGLNNPNPAPENVIQCIETFDEWMAASIIRMEETSRNLIDSSVINMDALWSEVSRTTADENRRALTDSTLEHLNNLQHHSYRINSPRINLGITFPGSGNKV